MENQRLNAPSFPQSSMPDKLPTPSSKTAGGGKLVSVTIAALLLVGGAAFWLTRDGETRDALREQATAALDSLTQDMPLASLGDSLRGARPAAPHAGYPQNRGAGGGAGTFGPVVQGAVAAPLDRSLPPEGSAAQTSPVVVVSPSGPAGASPSPQAAPPRVTADTTVRPDFIEDLAAYIVSRYSPGQRQGSLSLGIQGINQRYGTKMTGLADGGQSQGNRAGILRYVFSPAMIQGLYGLYVDRFLEALRERSAGKFFTPEQTRQLFMALAGRSVMLAGGLEGVAALPDLGGRLKKLEQVSRNVVSVNSEIMQVVFELDQLRESQAPRGRIDGAQARLDVLGARYRKALEERGAAQRALVADIRKGGGQSLDDDTLLFLAHWVERRLRDTPQPLISTRSAAGVLRDLARRCAQSGESPAAANASPIFPSGGLP